MYLVTIAPNDIEGRKIHSLIKYMEPEKADYRKLVKIFKEKAKKFLELKTPFAFLKGKWEQICLFFFFPYKKHMGCFVNAFALFFQNIFEK